MDIYQDEVSGGYDCEFDDEALTAITMQSLPPVWNRLGPVFTDRTRAGWLVNRKSELASLNPRQASPKPKVEGGQNTACACSWAWHRMKSYAA